MATGTLKRSRATKRKALKINKKNIAIAFLSQKGGVGKTTTAAHAREWFEQFGTVGFIDADAQRSSSKWIKKIDPEIPVTIIGDSKTLLKKIPELKKQYDFLIIDAPGSMEEVSRAILSRCDIAVIPCQTSQLDLDSNSDTLEMVEIAQDIRGGMPQAVLFFNRAEGNTVLLREAQEAIAEELEEVDVSCLKTIIHKRQCIMDVPGQQTTIFRAVDDIKSRRSKSVKRKTPEELAHSEYIALFEEIAGVINAN